MFVINFPFWWVAPTVDHLDLIGQNSHVLNRSVMAQLLWTPFECCTVMVIYISSITGYI